MSNATLDLPLHTGKCPSWLFKQMRKLARVICEIIINEQGTDFLLERLSEAFWLQAFGCVLGFDWHSSGLTTTVCGALKEACKDLSGYGVFVCGGKGATSRKTPREIEDICYNLGIDPSPLVYASRITAKVDNSCLQDGFQLYHHSFIFTKDKTWTVIQQGMSSSGQWARRYHWLSKGLGSFVVEPHKDIVTDKKLATLNMVAAEIDEARKACVKSSAHEPSENLKILNNIDKNKLPSRHCIIFSDINPKNLSKIFLKTYEAKPLDFQSLLSLQGVGPRTIRALALISELVYAAPLSFRDPARFSFAHGGKDGYPYSINRIYYNKTIDLLNRAVNKAKAERTDKIKALRRLYRFYNGS